MDGPAFFTKLGGLRRAGWAVVCINDDGSSRCCVYGVVPLAWPLSQSCRDAEDYAFHMLARFSVEPEAGGRPLFFSRLRWVDLLR